MEAMRCTVKKLIRGADWQTTLFHFTVFVQPLTAKASGLLVRQL